MTSGMPSDPGWFRSALLVRNPSLASAALHQPVISSGVLIDGRNRLAACEMAKGWTPDQLRQARAKAGECVVENIRGEVVLSSQGRSSAEAGSAEPGAPYSHLHAARRKALSLRRSLLVFAGGESGVLIRVGRRD